MARKKRRSKRKGKGGGLLGRDQQLEILAVGLLALALFVGLALVPVDLLGARSGELFPSGNTMGVVGGTVAALLRVSVGAAAFLVPLLVLLAGLRAGSWISPGWAVRLGILGVGLLVLLPPGLHVLAPDPAAGGVYGEAAGAPLVSALSWLGATLLLGAALVVLFVASLGWTPFRTVGEGVAQGRGVLRRGLGAAGARWRSRRRVPADAPSDEAPDPTQEPFERETGGDDDEAGDGPSRDEAPAAASGAAASDRDAPPPPPRPSPPDDFLPDPQDPRDLVGGELPPVDLLEWEEGKDRSAMERDLDRLGTILVEKLRTFNVQSELGGRTTGPMVTQYEVVPAPGVKVNRIANLDADLALAMKAQSIRIVAPIPGKGAVGVEIPNPEPEMVFLREILEAKEYRRARGTLPLALGKDLTGRPYVADLARMPHALIAGATGSGKSVCINTVITSLVCRHTPETLRLLMIDPKMVELSAYADLPHLRHPVVTDPKDAAGVLKWAVLEMERRYALLSANGVRSLAEFNKRVRDGVPLRRVDAEGDAGDEDRWVWDDGLLPYIVVVVDELADLMMQVQSEVEKPLAQLAQKARAIGIHLIVATQRPSVNVITGLIKANFPTRIAFRVASKTDSRTILDQNGAESLLGNGDMLFLPPGASETVRIQGAFISTEDTDALLGWYREQAARRAEEEGAEAPTFDGEPDILEELRSHELEEASAEVEEIAGDWDDLFRAAAEVCLQNDGGSTSLLQRKLRIGYGRAARIMDQLEGAGVLGPQDGSKPREVLVSSGELDQICGPSDAP